MSRAKATLEWMIDWKADLTRPQTQKVLGGFLESHLGRIDNVRLKNPDDNWETIGPLYAKDIHRGLELSEAYFLDREMLPVVIWGGRQLPDDATFEADLLPSPFGFVLLDEPWISKDARGREQVTKALYWHPMGMSDENGLSQVGTGVIYLTDPLDERDETSAFIMENLGLTRNQLVAMGRLQIEHIDFIRHGEVAGPQEIDTTDMEPDMYGLPPMPKSENQRRFVLSFLTMLNQTITAKTTETLQPKQAGRMAKRRMPSTVTVVHMRRISGANRTEGESHIEWAHRWIVRGHWRNQPVGPDYPASREVEPGKFVARIWIAPFVKGPDGAPFKVSQKVYSLDR